MRNLNDYAKECMNELDSIGIQYGNIEKWEVNTRAHKRWGQCKRLPDGNYSININADLLDERNDVNGLKNTIIHELLHSVKGCMNHGENWKSQAEIVHYNLGYNITRCSSASEKGITYRTEIKPRIESKKDYVIKCTCCGHEYHRTRMVDSIKHPENYRCGACKGKLVRIK